MKKIYFSLVVSILIFFAGEIFAQPQPPVLIDPCGVTNVELYPTFTWYPSTNANRYHLQVFQGVNVVIDNSNITTPSYTVVSAVLTNNTTYYWQVRASSNGGVTWSGWSSTCTFTTIAQGPGIPNLLSPPNDTINVPLTPLMQWEDVGGAASYRIQIADNPGFSPTVVDVGGLPNPPYQVQPGALNNNTLYYWRIRAYNSSGVPSDWSVVWHFTTIPGVPPAPILSSPPNGSTGRVQPVLLVWNAASGASDYEYQVSLNNIFSQIVYTKSGIGILQDTIPPILIGLTQYFWRVRGHNISGNGAWSTIWNFTTASSPPLAPNLSSPQNHATGVSLTPTLTWNAVPGTGITYRVQLSLSSTFNTTIINVGNLIATQYTVPASANLQNNTKYYWRVNATNSAGTGPWSAVWDFTTLLPLPPAPTLIYPPNNSTGISLTPLFDWTLVTQAAHYRINVSPNASFTPLVINEVVDIDQYQTPPGPLTGFTHYYWRVASINSENNQGPWSTTFNFTTMQTMNCNLKVFLEGFYDGTSQLQVQDTVKIYLAQGTSPFSFWDSSAVYLGTNGSGIVSFSHAPTGFYYIIIKHRNHLETWSANSIQFSTGITVPYDFTTSQSMAYCGNMKQVGSVWVLWGGDCLNDGAVNAFDYNLFKTQFGRDGYNNCDLNGDGFVDGYDFLILNNNIGKSYCRP